MTTKQLAGSNAPDGATYACLTNGAGTLGSFTKASAAGTKHPGKYAPDGSEYLTLTNGSGTLV